MAVQVASPRDIRAWLELAAEVEALFGPMVAEPGFHAALAKNVDRGTAFCVRVKDGPPGTALMGGLLFSPRPPSYEVGWLAVAKLWRRRGVGTALVSHACSLVVPPADLLVTTFGSDIPDGLAARRFYRKMGFTPFAAAPRGPDGGSREVFRRALR